MTEDQLKAILDAALAKQSERLDKRFVEQAEQLNKQLTKQTMAFERQLAGFVGQVTQHVDETVTTFRDEVKRDSNRIYNLVDGLAKRLDTDDQERAAITSQLDRHEGWIGQLAQDANTKLVPEP
jgi:hypothetical protein